MARGNIEYKSKKMEIKNLIETQIAEGNQEYKALERAEITHGLEQSVKNVGLNAYIGKGVLEKFSVLVVNMI